MSQQCGRTRSTSSVQEESHSKKTKVSSEEKNDANSRTQSPTPPPASSSASDLPANQNALQYVKAIGTKGRKGKHSKTNAIVFRRPSSLALTQDGRTLFAADYDGFIHVINTETSELERQIDLLTDDDGGQNYKDVILVGSDRILLVACGQHNFIKAIDVQSGRILKSSEFPDDFLCWASAFGSNEVYMGLEGRIEAYSIQDDWSLSLLWTIRQCPVGTALTARVTTTASIEKDTLTSYNIIYPADIMLSSSGNHLTWVDAFTDYGRYLTTMDLSNQHAVSVILDEVEGKCLRSIQPYAISMSVDERIIYVGDIFRSRICIIDARTGDWLGSFGQYGRRAADTGDLSVTAVGVRFCSTTQLLYVIDLMNNRIVVLRPSYSSCPEEQK